MEKLAAALDPGAYSSLTEVITEIAERHGKLKAFSCLGTTLSYAELDQLSSRFANFLQNETALQPGDRIALQLPNLLQFPVALYGALKAGLIVVNTNPLYTAKEMAHQFTDSGVKAVVILDAFCAKLEEILPQTEIACVVVAKLGDLQPALKSVTINLAARYLRKLVPAYRIGGSVAFMDTLKSPASYAEPEPRGKGDDVAVILYTGGTTGVSKGAMLSHSNLIANMMQLRARCLLIIDDQIETIAAPLPLYHSYAFLLHCLAMPYAGNHSILIPNPRDIDGVIKLMKQFPVSGFVGINTLYLALLRHPRFGELDFSMLKFCGAGGMAMSTSVSAEWQRLTGVEVFEGYGLTECSPVVSVNIPGRVKQGTVGPPVPETEVKAVDEAGREVAVGERGEAWIRGPQVMLGYWNRPEATAEAITEDGWFRSGDFIEIDHEGFISIVDRKKDMILVSGFNVFPNEIEDWVNSHPAVLESAAIGVPNERSGEEIRLFVVMRHDVPADERPDRDALVAYCREGLTSYKVPKDIRFVNDLPKSNVGKILRRALREETDETAGDTVKQTQAS
jgi:long-chain acyl-CoA synthetase